MDLSSLPDVLLNYFKCAMMKYYEMLLLGAGSIFSFPLFLIRHGLFHD